MQELIFRTDRDGVFTYVNARWNALWGEPPASAIGRRLQDLVAPESQERVAAMLDPRSPSALRTRQLRVRSPWAASGCSTWRRCRCAPRTAT